MGQLRVAQLDPGWTAAIYRETMLNLMGQSWGGYTLYHGASIDSQFAEFTGLDGAKHYINFSSASQINMQLASDVDVLTRSGGTSYNAYRNISSVASSLLPNTFSGSATTFMLTMTSGQYRVFMALNGSVTVMAGVALLQRVPAFWGSSKRVWIFGTNYSGSLLAGENPWGTYDPVAKTVSVAGVTTVTARSADLPTSPNTLQNLRQITKNHACANPQAVIGYLPDDFVYMAATGVNPMTKYQDETGTQYVMLHNGIGVQLDAAQ